MDDKAESVLATMVGGIGFIPENARVMAEKAPLVAQAYMKMRNKLLAEGAVPARTKILTALALMVALGMEEGLENYLKIAENYGISKEEIVEIAGVAICFSGGKGIDSLIKLCRRLP